jgi:hypothetical protein
MILEKLEKIRHHELGAGETSVKHLKGNTPRRIFHSECFPRDF